MSFKSYFELCVATMGAFSVLSFPTAALASDLSIFAERFGDETVTILGEPSTSKRLRRSTSRGIETGTWVTFSIDATESETGIHSYQESCYFVESEPNEDGSITVHLKTTIHNIDYNFVHWTTTKTIFCDGEQVAFIPEDYSEADAGESIEQEVKFRVHGGGPHRITSVETEFRSGTETHAGWDIVVNVPFVITATASEGGSFTPDGSLYAYPGDSASFTVTPDEGYRIDTVRIDGVEQDPQSVYEFKDIDADHTITATFRKIWYVNFVDGVSGDLIKTVQVDDGCSVQPPVAPSHEGYRFNSWQGSMSGIHKDTTVTARYDKTFDVVFLDHEGTEISHQTVISGEDAVDPGIPDRDGYTSVGWDTPITGIEDDLVVHPVYEPIISVDVPTVVACIISSTGEVIEPTSGYSIRNDSVVDVKATSIMVRDLPSNTRIRLLDGEQVVFDSDGPFSSFIIPKQSSKGFTWNVDDLDPKLNEDLISDALDGPITLCNVCFTFESAE